MKTQKERVADKTKANPSLRSKKWTTINVEHDLKLEIQRKVLEEQYKTPNDYIWALINESQSTQKGGAR